MLEPVTPRDIAAVAKQLGREPRGILAVVSRSRYGWPQVVLTAPLVSTGLPSHGVEGFSPEHLPAEDVAFEVFPTQFWLTCPLLRDAVGDLEAEGWTGRLEARLREDVAFRWALEAAHAAAARFRWALVPAAWQRRLEAPAYEGQRRVLYASGVAGIRCRPGAVGGVKCLHAHYADYLGRGPNPIGEWVAEELARRGVPRWCDDRCPERCGVEVEQGVAPHRGVSRGTGPSTGDGVGSGRGSGLSETRKRSRVAAVDIGTHSVRLLVAERSDPPLSREQRSPKLPSRNLGEREPAWREVERRQVITRLGEGWRRGSVLRPQAVERTLSALREFAAVIAGHRVDHVTAIATAVVREAIDGAEFAARVLRETGLVVRVVDGGEEAALSFRGVAAGLVASGRVSPSEERWAVLDVGGGSTELVVGWVGSAGDEPTDAAAEKGRDKEKPGPFGRPGLAMPFGLDAVGGFPCRVLARRSEPVGAVRVAEEFFRHDPPTEEEWAAALRHARALLARAAGVARGAGEVVRLAGVGGTVTSLAAIDQGLSEYRRELVHGYRLSREQVAAWAERLRTLPLRERQRLPGLQPERAPVIHAGVAIVLAAMDAVRAPSLEVSDWDLLEGLLYP